ncbi:MAG: long-chain fatty acid--CoA ligase [Bacillota bacterium]|nr:long-chain fatty acid--CoA ligase [Bacillota bacterium]
MVNQKAYKEDTIPGIFYNLVEKNHEKPFLRYHDGDVWQNLSWDTVKDKVYALASYLINNGIKPGDKLAIYSENRPEWVIADLATLSAGAADVTIYATSSGPEAAYIINDSGCRFCFCGTTLQAKNLLSQKENIPTLEKIIVFDNLDIQPETVSSLNSLLKEGQAKLKMKEIDKRLRDINPEDIMTIIYTSGTTGNPKGAMLTHTNMVAQVLQYAEHHGFPPWPGDPTLLSILPLSHALERTVGYHWVMYINGTICYSRGTEYLLEDLIDFRPGALITVPRIEEKIYEGIMNNLQQQPVQKQKLFHWALAVSREALPYFCNNQKTPFPLNVKHKLAYKMILSKIRAAIGLNNCAVIGVGGGPIAKDVVEFFLAMGIQMHPGYGLTETAPMCYVNTWNFMSPIKPLTCGVVMPGTEIKFAEDGEILLKGPQVFKGYFNKPDETREAFTEDGWFKSGDIGSMDENGYLSITDRKKDIIITAGGKNISPQVIETTFNSDPFIEQIAIIGDRKKYIVALIVPNFERLQLWAKENNIEDCSNEELVTSPMVFAKYQETIDLVNESLSKVEKIKKFALLPYSFSQETGELTPTLKIKRKVVAEKCSQIIESLYQNDQVHLDVKENHNAHNEDSKIAIHN